VVKIATFAKPETVTSNAMTTVQTINNSAKTNDTMPTLRKIKREATPPTKANAVASHFILPNRTTTSLKSPLKTSKISQKKTLFFNNEMLTKSLPLQSNF